MNFAKCMSATANIQMVNLSAAKNLRSSFPRVFDCDAQWPAYHFDAGWSSLVARQAHNLKAAGSNPAPATKFSLDGCNVSCVRSPKS